MATLFVLLMVLPCQSKNFQKKIHKKWQIYFSYWCEHWTKFVHFILLRELKNVNSISRQISNDGTGFEMYRTGEDIDTMRIYVEQFDNNFFGVGGLKWVKNVVKSLDANDNNQLVDQCTCSVPSLESNIFYLPIRSNHENNFNASVYSDAWCSLFFV